MVKRNQAHQRAAAKSTERESGVHRVAPVAEPFASGIEFAVRASRGEFREADVRRVGGEVGRDFARHLGMLHKTVPELDIAVLIADRLKAERRAALLAKLRLVPERVALEDELRSATVEIGALHGRISLLTKRRIELLQKLGYAPTLWKGRRK